jgi:hypothetical protein
MLGTADILAALLSISRDLCHNVLKFMDSPVAVDSEKSLVLCSDKFISYTH